MRILVMLNPTNKHGTKTSYAAFRKFLLSDGYVLLGPELYIFYEGRKIEYDKTEEFQ